MTYTIVVNYKGVWETKNYKEKNLSDVDGRCIVIAKTKQLPGEKLHVAFYRDFVQTVYLIISDDEKQMMAEYRKIKYSSLQ